MGNLKIALLQLNSGSDLKGNLEKGLKACCKAQKMGADLALFPEMWSNGYGMEKSRDDLMAEAIEEKSDLFWLLADWQKIWIWPSALHFLRKKKTGFIIS